MKKTPRIDPPARLTLASLLLAFTAAALGSAAAKSASYTYYRFRATALRNASNKTIQLSDLNFYNSAASATIPLTAATATDSDNNNSGDGYPAYAIDNLHNTKWLNFDYTTGYLTIGFNSPTTIDSYNYYTGNDTPDRDPISWILEGSNDPNGSWTILDIEKNQIPSSTRSVPGYTTNFVLPDNPPGVINSFVYADPYQSTIIKNGSTLQFSIDAQAPTITLTPTPSGTTVAVTSPDVTVTPPPSALTTYTLLAHSPAGDDSRSLPIRTVPGATLSYRYIRYTPLKLASGSSIGLDDFSFKRNGVAVPVVAVENPGGNATAASPVTNLIDDPINNFGTTYVSVMSPVIFDFGAAAVSYDSYAFSTGANLTQRPLRWLIEGSNDKTSWTLVTNVNFDFNTPAGADFETADIPFDGAAVAPYVSLSSDAILAAAGSPLHLSYSVLGAASGVITPGNITVSGTGTVTVTPSANTVYTLTASSSGGSAQASVSQSVVASIAASLSYPSFNDASQIQVVGNASVLVDSSFTADPVNKRIRLTPNASSQHGAAWYKTPIRMNLGFDTSYDAFIANMTSTLGADGIAFVVQNVSTGSTTLNGDTVHLTTNSVSVDLDGFPDAAGESGFASVEIWKANTLVDVVPLPALGLAHGGTYLPDYNNAAASPYHMRVIYTPPLTTGASGAMTVYVDGVKVIDSFAITLEDAGAVDATGKAYVGFVARTGLYTETQDITSWSLTSAGPALTTPLAITSSVFDTTAHTVTLNYSATSGNTYRVTTSTDLATWTQVSGTSNSAATSASGSFSFSYTPGAKAFFRVEQVTP